MVASLQVERFVFNAKVTDGHASLKVVANRYRDGRDSSDGVTLFLAHGTGTHKEHWEPTLQSVFGLQHSKDRCHQIREAWAFDWQSHGDSAVLNKVALASRPEGIPVREWGLFLADFVKSEHVQGHRIVAIGHSAGACAVVLSMCGFNLDSLPYHSIILVETPMIQKEVYEKNIKDRERALRMLSKAILSRRDTWPSKMDALGWFSKRLPWSGWDADVLKVYAEYGLYPITCDMSEGVALKCDKNLEATSYSDTGAYFEATNQLTRVTPYISVHLIFGAKSDSLPRYARDSVIAVGRGYLASVVQVADAGHMVLQEKPKALAAAIVTGLDPDKIPTSKL